MAEAFLDEGRVVTFPAFEWQPCHITVEAWGVADIAKVEILKNTRLVYQMTPNERGNLCAGLGRLPGLAGILPLPRHTVRWPTGSIFTGLDRLISVFLAMATDEC